MFKIGISQKADWILLLVGSEMALENLVRKQRAHFYNRKKNQPNTKNKVSVYTN